MTVRRCEAGTLELGAGLEVLVSASLRTLPEGGRVEVECAARSSALELAAWARTSGHEVLAERTVGSGAGRRWLVEIRRGPLQAPAPERVAAPRPFPEGTFPTSELRAAGAPAPADEARDADLVPISALAGPPRSGYEWALGELDRVWADELAMLVDRAARLQWDASRDIPWEAAGSLPDEVEAAVCQVMTYLAQNEYAAYYVPARYLGQVSPQYLEVLMWLASHVHDEARHVEVFTKRALAGGMQASGLASTELSLKTLLEERDFTAAALLLNVLGEGTFLDLLRFVERHAPDAATATAARLAHRDELRHVHFGIAHVRRRLEREPELRQTLVAAVEARAAKLVSLDGFSSELTEALTLMAAGSHRPADIAEAGAALRALLHSMHVNRVRRLRAAGFDEKTAGYLSELHTPNLM